MVLNESQSLKDTFIIYVILMLEVPTIILFVVLWWTGKFGEDGYIPVLFFIGFLSLTTLFILNMSLQIRIDENGLQYKSFPFVNKWKFLPKEAIDSGNVRKLDGMLEFGGLGTKLSKSTKAYIFSTEHVIELESSGKKYVFSTRKPILAKTVIEQWNIPSIK